ncbi:disulfide-isomerase [Plectosphaerella plurivora]|uniref:Protein disulfide-isomerase n=1 Tax=Plectosphaerella plurivora TaxID=936078 RepID=A0A9P9AD65_9PEZI|nr:disulfide-isomerase [Plectosphaerella plurivora]
MHCKAIALGFLAAATGAFAADDSDVVQLKQDTFADFVKGNELVLAEFFAPWCGHCKALAPEYEEAATTLKEKDIRLVKVDCTEEADLCAEYGVEGYPTLKVFRGLDNVSAYSGQRKAAAITSYMVKQSLPAVSLLTKDTLEEFKTADKVVLVAYVDATDKASNETFTKVADKLRDTFLFGGVNDAELAKAEGVEAPAIVLYKSFDEGKATFTKAFDAEAIEAFAQTASTPLIGEVGPETYSGYMSAGLPLAYIFAETPEERETLGSALKPLAEKHRGVINFATIDAKSFGAHAGNLNLQADKFPAFAIQEVVKNQKFPYDQEKEITLETITTFVDEFVSGKMEPSIKSEPIPEVQEGVTVVVAKNYDEIVLDDTKDVLLEFYAPWCGHCKALAPKYDELAALYADSEFKDKVVIAKVDATLNDVPDEIQGFPTIKLFPAGSKGEPITYSGARTVEDFIEFIGENGKYKAALSKKEEVAEESQAAPAASESKETEEAKESAHDEL